MFATISTHRRRGHLVPGNRGLRSPVPEPDLHERRA